MKNDFRQKLHLEPFNGWLNDPNGLCFFGGKYHVYFQYCPQDAYGKGEKCWGHFESPDLINWTFKGVAIRPDSPDDRSGAYSGCGIVAENTLHIFYTGNVKKDGDYDYINSGREANVIHLTTKDGQNMSEKVTVLRNSDYPDYCSCHVRDPKVWEENGIYYMVLGARTRDGKGCVLYYSSNNLSDWTFEKTETLKDFGYMWECPDVIDISDKKILSFSPQGMNHGDFSHQNIYSSGYLNNGEFIEWDYGFDFYAPQTFTAPDGRKLLIGWMGIGDIPYFNPTANFGWQHCLTLPRELSLGKNGEIFQRPVSEIDSLRQDIYEITEEKNINAELPFELIGNASKDFVLKIDFLKMSFDSGVFSLEFSDMAVSGERTKRRVKLGTLKNIRLLADTSSIEIYLNDGERVMSSRFYPKDTETDFSIKGFSGKLYRLKGLNVTKGAEK